MLKKGVFGLFLLFGVTVFAQSIELPADFRQHNLTDYNANLFSPVLSLVQTEQQRLSLWTRWQWQSIDSDPTTLYLSYLRREGNSAFGGGFFQHNTGLFQQTGGVLNFAYQIPVGDDFGLSFGLNLFGYKRELADDRLTPGDPILPIENEVNDFILQMAPGMEVNIERFAMGIAVDNLFDYNFTQSESVTGSDQKTTTVMGRYAFNVSENSAGRQTFLQPQLYYRRIPGYDNQIGLNALWSAPTYWAQAGYNSYYGFSAGLGGRLFQRVSLGALLEFGSNDNPQGGDTSFEVVMALSFGKKQQMAPEEKPEEELIVQEEVTEEEAAVAAQIAAQQEALQEAARRQDSLGRLSRQQELALEKRRDSIRQMEEAALALRKTRDSLRQAEAEALALEEKVVPDKGEKYQEVNREEGLQPGYYLIANVFSTKKYYNLFMKRLQDAELEPKSFYRSVNKFNYVYLMRYTNISEAREARDSKFGGQYLGDLWIFRVR